MKAARLYGKLDIRMDEVPDPPAPGEGEVLIRIGAVGIRKPDDAGP